MLSLGSGSTCDVCFGSFVDVPICSLQCGHVFCECCINECNPKKCPLCRVPFHPEEAIKLHIGLAEGSPSANQEARKLQDCIIRLGSSGATESELKQLITDCRTFLDNNRPMFQDLRHMVRLVTYLFDIRIKFRTQGAELNTLQAEVTQLEQENAKLEKRIQDLQEFRQYEKETATQVENTLREHSSRAHEAYETMVHQFNFLSQEWMRLYEENKVLRMTVPPISGPSIPFDLGLDEDSGSGSGSGPQFHPLARLNQDKLKSAALQDPETYLISPLPQFTGRLPTPPSLSDEGEGFEDMRKLKRSPKAKQQEMPQVDQTMYSSPHSTRCDAAGHPYTCDCEGFEIFGENGRSGPSLAAATPGFKPATSSYKASSHSTPVAHGKMPITTHNGSLYSAVPPTSYGSIYAATPAPNGSSCPVPPSPTIRPIYPTPPTPPNGSSFPVPPTPSGTSYPVPMTPGRARSHTIANHSSRSPSRVPSRASSPTPKSNSAASSRGVRPNHTDNETLKSRLHDILQDSSSVSSSLPNMSSFPSAYTQHRATPQSPALQPHSPPDASTSSLRHGVRNASPNLNDRKPSPRGSSGSNDASPPLPLSSAIPPSFVNSGTTTISRASSAAAAIENERKNRKKAEQQTASAPVKKTIDPAAIASINYARSQAAARESAYTDSTSNRQSHRPPNNSRTQGHSP